MNECWRMSSNDGWNEVSGTVIQQWADAEYGSVYLMDVVIRGDFWKRTSIDRGYMEIQNTVRDYETRLPQVLMNKKGFQELRAQLQGWLDNKGEVEVELSGLENQSFKIRFELRTDTVLNQLKPYFILRYEADRFPCGKWRYAVDETCIREFMDGIAEFV